MDDYYKKKYLKYKNKYLKLKQHGGEIIKKENIIYDTVNNTSESGNNINKTVVYNNNNYVFNGKQTTNTNTNTNVDFDGFVKNDKYKVDLYIKNAKYTINSRDKNMINFNIEYDDGFHCVELDKDNKIKSLEKISEINFLNEIKLSFYIKMWYYCYNNKHNENNQYLNIFVNYISSLLNNKYNNVIIENKLLKNNSDIKKERNLWDSYIYDIYGMNLQLFCNALPNILNDGLINIINSFMNFKNIGEIEKSDFMESNVGDNENSYFLKCMKKEIESESHIVYYIDGEYKICMIVNTFVENEKRYSEHIFIHKLPSTVIYYKLNDKNKHKQMAKYLHLYAINKFKPNYIISAPLDIMLPIFGSLEKDGILKEIDKTYFPITFNQYNKKVCYLPRKFYTVNYNL